MTTVWGFGLGASGHNGHYRSGVQQSVRDDSSFVLPQVAEKHPLK